MYSFSNYIMLRESRKGLKTIKTFGFDNSLEAALDWYEDNIDNLDQEDWQELRYRLLTYFDREIKSLEKTQLPGQYRETRDGKDLQKGICFYLGYSYSILHSDHGEQPEKVFSRLETEEFPMFEDWLNQQKVTNWRGEEYLPAAREWLKRATQVYKMLKLQVPRIQAINLRYRGTGS